MDCGATRDGGGPPGPAGAGLWDEIKRLAGRKSGRGWAGSAGGAGVDAARARVGAAAGLGSSVAGPRGRVRVGAAGEDGT